MNKILRINRVVKSFDKKIFVAWDKSLSIRWVLMASLSKKKSTAYNLLISEDVLSDFRESFKYGRNEVSAWNSVLENKLILSNSYKVVVYYQIINNRCRDHVELVGIRTKESSSSLLRTLYYPVSNYWSEYTKYY